MSGVFFWTMQSLREKASRSQKGLQGVLEIPGPAAGIQGFAGKGGEGLQVPVFGWGLKRGWKSME